MKKKLSIVIMLVIAMIFAGNLFVPYAFAQDKPRDLNKKEFDALKGHDNYDSKLTQGKIPPANTDKYESKIWGETLPQPPKDNYGSKIQAEPQGKTNYLKTGSIVVLKLGTSYLGYYLLAVCPPLGTMIIATNLIHSGYMAGGLVENFINSPPPKIINEWLIQNWFTQPSNKRVMDSELDKPRNLENRGQSPVRNPNNNPSVPILGSGNINDNYNPQDDNLSIGSGDHMMNDPYLNSGNREEDTTEGETPPNIDIDKMLEDELNKRGFNEQKENARKSKEEADEAYEHMIEVDNSP